MNGLIDDDLVELLRTISLEENDVATKEKRDLPCAAVYGGMAFIGANRLRPGFVEHSDEGSLLGGIAAISKPEEDEEEELKALVELWKPTKVKFTEERLLIRGRWIKNCWNLPFNSVSCAMGGTLTIDKIVRDPSLRKLANDIMDETIAIANADLASRGVSSSMLLGDQLVRNTSCKAIRNESSIRKLFNLIPLLIHLLFGRKHKCGLSQTRWDRTKHQRC